MQAAVPSCSPRTETGATDRALWESLPVDVWWNIVDLLPSLQDVVRLGRTSRSFHDLVEAAMQTRCVEMMHKSRAGASRGSDSNVHGVEDEEEVVVELRGGQSWVRVVASRQGLLPPNKGLIVEPTEDDTYAEGSYNGLGDMVTCVGGSDDDDAMMGAIDNFEELDLPGPLVRSLHDFGIERPSHLQRRALRPLTATRRDILLRGPSGTGRTSACAIGILCDVNPDVLRCQAILLVPSREVAVAIVGCYFKGFGGPAMGVQALEFTGDRGNYRGTQSAREEGEAQVAVGTPSHLLEAVHGRALNFREVRTMVLDDAERLLWDFRQDIYELFRGMPVYSRVVIVASEISEDVLCLATNVLSQDPLRITMRRDYLDFDRVRQYFLAVDEEDWKIEVLCDLSDVILGVRRIVVYVNTQRKAEWLAEVLQERSDFDFDCFVLRGDTEEREHTIQEFQSSMSHLLIVHEMYALTLCQERNQDVAYFFINYDLPTNRENYLLRIGRKGRFRCVRIAITFVTPEDVSRLHDIEQFYCISIEEMPMDLCSLF